MDDKIRFYHKMGLQQKEIISILRVIDGIVISEEYLKILDSLDDSSSQICKLLLIL